MARLGDWLKKSAERMTEVLLGADLQSRLCAYIDMLCASRADGILPTRFRIELDQGLFDQKLEEYRAQTGNDLTRLEGELAEVAKGHILGKGRAYRTYADTVTVKLEPHVMTKGVKIIADFPKEKAIATALGVGSEARGQRPEDITLETVARPVSATFDSRSLETVVHEPGKPVNLETRVIPAEPERPPAARSAPPPAAGGMETRVYDADEQAPEEDSAAGMETRVVDPSTRETPPSEAGMETRVAEPTAGPPPAGDSMETRVYEPSEQPEDRAGDLASDEMATVMEEPARIAYRLSLVEPDEKGEYEETESWMLEAGRTYTIGRSRKNDIVIQTGTVSRLHSQLEMRPDGTALLSDGGSSHGTFVNGEPVAEPTAVKPGDDIQLTQKGAAHLALQPMDR